MESKDNMKRSFMRGRDTAAIYTRNIPEGRVILESYLEEESDASDVYETSSAQSIESQASSAVGGNNPETASVYLRIRPVELDSNVWKFRIEQDSFVAANIENAQTKNKNTVEQHYKFTQVFDDFSSQMDIYNTCVKPLISLDDSATIMVYGTSGSGKTHTLLGDPYSPGLVPRALSQIFLEYGNNISNYPMAKMKNGIPCVIPDDQMFLEEKHKCQLFESWDGQDSNFTQQQMLQNLKNENSFEARFMENLELFIWVSFVEIYNEEVFDLLAPTANEENKENNSWRSNTSTKRKHLKVMSNNGQPFVRDVSTIFVRTFEETIKILQHGIKRVSTGETIINQRSSRSHCIFFVDVIKFSKLEMTSTSYKFCDLAGSERLKKTENVGKRLKEAKNINTSLMTLGRCLAMANERQKNKSSLIPYRDSKLTILLQNALLGHEKITLIVNLNPKLEYIEENLNVLSFASIAKEIITKPKERTSHKGTRVTRYSFLLSKMVSSSASSQLYSTMNDLQAHNEDLINKVIDLEAEVTRLNHEMVDQERILRKSIVEALDEEYERSIGQYEKQIASMKLNHKSQIDSFETWLSQKDSVIEKQSARIRRLEAKLQKLAKSEGISCDDSESDSDTDSDNSND